jgi:hypothetical protein
MQVNTLMNFDISHAVDDSDIAFALRLDRKSTVCSMMSSRSTTYHKVGTNIDAFINLATVNYLLAGLQLCYVNKNNTSSKWFDLLHDLDQYQYPAHGVQLTLWDLRYITRELIVPFGIARGSEKQGGQDETGLSPATWPVNFVTNLVLDGHERNVVNYWHYHDISAGDDLVFRLKPMPIPRGKRGYTLNHYYKGFVQHNFESYFLQNMGGTPASHVWQLVPDVFSLDYRPENDENNGNSSVTMPKGFEVPENYTWQEHGYWHIGRSQVMFRKYALEEYYNDDMANQLKVNHMEMTFEPSYCKMPGECRDTGNPRCVKVDQRAINLRNPDTADKTVARDSTAVAPGMMAPAQAMPWAPHLMLEGSRMAEFIAAPMPRLRDQEGLAPAKQPRHELELSLQQATEREPISREAEALRLFGGWQPAAEPVSLKLWTAPALDQAPNSEEPISLVFSSDPEPPAAALDNGASVTSALQSVLSGRLKKPKGKDKDPPAA